MASILSFVKPHHESFEPETVRLMGDAFDAACKKSFTILTPDTREAIAVRIIDAAAAGERDPARLLEAGLGRWRK
jgi:hypothetical protein